MADEMAALRRRASTFRDASRACSWVAPRGRADALDGQVGRAVPAVRRVAPRAPISAASTATTTSTSASATPGAMAGHGPGADDRRRRAPDAPRHHPHAPDRGRGLGRRGADPTVRRRRLAVRAVGDRRQPLGRSASPGTITGRSKVVVHDHCYHGSVDEAIAMLGPDGSVVPVRGSVGPQVDVARDDARRRVQRRRRARGRRWPTATSPPCCSSRP